MTATIKHQIRSYGNDPINMVREVNLSPSEIIAERIDVLQGIDVPSDSDEWESVVYHEVDGYTIDFGGELIGTDDQLLSVFTGEVDLDYPSVALWNWVIGIIDSDRYYNDVLYENTLGSDPCTCACVKERHDLYYPIFKTMESDVFIGGRVLCDYRLSVFDIVNETYSIIEESFKKVEGLSFYITPQTFSTMWVSEKQKIYNTFIETARIKFESSSREIFRKVASKLLHVITEKSYQEYKLDNDVLVAQRVSELKKLGWEEK